MEKAANNKKCADWASKENLHDIAVSRLYYSLYQKILNQSNGTINTGKGSHIKTIENYFNLVNNSTNSRATQSLMQKMRKLRNKADYEKNKISDSEYKYAERLYNKIDQYINKERGDICEEK